MITKPGFTIIEAVISFFITILFVSLVFQFSAKFYSNLLEKSNFRTIFLENYTAFDHIARNLSLVPVNKENWLKISEKQVIWTDFENKIDKGYLVQDNNLYFVTGKYENGIWTHSRKNLLSTNAKEVKFVQNMQNFGESAGPANTSYIGSIVCTLVYEIKNKNYELKRTIGLRNGIIV